MVQIFKSNFCILRNIWSRFIFYPFASLSLDFIQDWAKSKQFLFNCVWANSKRGKSGCKCKTGVKKTHSGENNHVFINSIFFWGGSGILWIGSQSPRTSPYWIPVNLYGFTSYVLIPELITHHCWWHRSRSSF